MYVSNEIVRAYMGLYKDLWCVLFGVWSINGLVVLLRVVVWLVLRVNVNLLMLVECYKRGYGLISWLVYGYNVLA